LTGNPNSLFLNTQETWKAEPASIHGMSWLKLRDILSEKEAFHSKIFSYRYAVCIHTSRSSGYIVD
jgi:hypothetical protein